MNSFKYIKIVMLMFVLILASCDNNLDEVPLSSLTPENLFQTENDANAAAIGMYQGLLSSNTWGVLTPVYGWGIMGTDVWSIAANNTGEQSRFSRYSLSSAEDQVKKHWTNTYSIINRANNVLAYTGNIDAPEEVINSYLAEAYFIRALSYMDLVQYYGGVPLRIKPTTSIEDDLALPRASEKETWTLVISDLQFAERYLPSTADAGRATKWAAKGLLAKAYLTRGGYPVGKYQEPEWFEKAAKTAFEVISQSGKVLNPTSTGNPNAFREYGDQFLVSGENSSESLFEIQFLELDYGGGWGYRSISGGKRFDNSESGSYYALWGGSTVGTDFALSFDDNDIRFQWSIGPFGLNNNGRAQKPFTGWMPYKFRWESIPGNAWASSTNAIVLRMADVYLMYAEASNEATGDPNNSTYGMSAYDAINVVRQRAQVDLMDDTYLTKASPFSTNDLLYGMSFQSFQKNNANYDGRHVYYTGGLKESFRAAVLQERAWELCFERHRWFDLKRTGKLLDFARNTMTNIGNGGRLATSALVDPIDKSQWLNATNQPKSGFIAWPPSGIQDYSLYMPIPDVEIQMNPALSQADQNPGY